jgi:hypothetical protein
VAESSRPPGSLRGGRVAGRGSLGERAAAGDRVFKALYRRGLEANIGGGALAFVYLAFVAPPQPAPPHSEQFLYLAVAPVYAAVAAVAGYRIARRGFRPVDNWLAEDRQPTREERALVLSLPGRTAGLAAAVWLGASAIFAAVTATHHPAVFVAGTVVGILLAGLTSAAVTFLLCERTMRPVFALALAGEVPSEGQSPRVLGTAPRLLVSWALGSGVALIAIAVAFLGRGDSRGDELIGPILFLVVVGLLAGGLLIAAAARSLSDPVERVRSAVERVEEGSLEEEASSTTAARSAFSKRVSTGWWRDFGSESESARRSVPMSTGTSPSTSCARALGWPARRSRSR